MTQNNRERLRQAQASAAKQKRLTRTIGIGAAILAVVILGVIIGVMFQNQGKATVPGSVTPPNATSDGRAIVMNPGKAKPGVPVVELFFDYQCPVCHQFESLYGGAFTSLAASGDIDLRYRTMTFLDQNIGNDASLRAGIAATCADVADPAKYSDFHNAIYANQPKTEGDGYPDTVLRETIPASVGITGDALKTFQSCYDKQSTKAFVSGMNDLGMQDMQRVNKSVATPTVHVNGKDLPLREVSTIDPKGAAAETDLLNLIKKSA